MKKICLILGLICSLNAVVANEAANLSADEALAKLKTGNANFAKMHLTHPDTDKKRRVELLGGQHPFVAILSCSDSRVPPELIFDQGLGDIFEIRNAGNVLDEHIIGSIEYAVMHLGVKLVVIMGHSDCGAIKATLAQGRETDYIETLKKAIKPAVLQCQKENNLSVDNVVKVHAKNDVKNLLEQDKELNEYIKAHGVSIIPAYYNLETGLVEFFVE